MLGQYSKHGPKQLSQVIFHDTGGRECSLQQSSAATQDCIWLGTLGYGSIRMHLNREQVEGLVKRLQQWIDTGDFEETKCKD